MLMITGCWTSSLWRILAHNFWSPRFYDISPSCMTRPYKLIINKTLNSIRHRSADFLTVTDKSRETIWATCFHPDYQVNKIEENYSEEDILKIRQIRLTTLRTEQERWSQEKQKQGMKRNLEKKWRYKNWMSKKSCMSIRSWRILRMGVSDLTIPIWHQQ